MMNETARARARSDDPTPYPPYSTKCMGAHTKCMGHHTFCMEQPVHAWCAQYCTVLYCAHLAIFMQYTGVFPTIQLEIPTFHSIYAQVQLGILALKSTNQPELGSKRPPP